MKQNGIKLTAFTYNKFIGACLESENYKQALHYLKEMEITNFPPSIRTIFLLIKFLVAKKTYY